MKVCWNAIVKNEAARIGRCMQSLIDHVDCAVIYDTGSTDSTPQDIELFFHAHKKPCTVILGHFDNFEQARNEALGYACNSGYDFDYMLLVDADMELRGSIPKDFAAPAAQVMQKAGVLEYYNTRLVHRMAGAKYIGVTHEFLSVNWAHQVPPDQMYFIDHFDGENRKDKYVRDIKLLKEALSKDPDNARYWFYLAQSYRDAGQPEDAYDAYLKRVMLGGWDQEVWNAQLNVAHCLKDMGDVDGFVSELLRAHEMRPQRAEALYDLARFYRDAGKNSLATLFARGVQSIPRPDDTLFINEYVYSVGGDEEMSIAAFYTKDRVEGAKACDRLVLGTHGYDAAKQQARTNLFHYLSPIPGLRSKELKLDTGCRATMNPSIINVGGDLRCILRGVNYVITPEGRYDIDGKGSDISADNPIKTTNFLLDLSPELEIKRSRQIFTPWANEFPLVKGWEDMRLFKPNYGPDLRNLWVSATVREANEQGRCEQWIGKLAVYEDIVEVVDEKRLPSFQDHEKNWMPLQGQYKFVYQLGKYLEEGSSLIQTRCPVNPTDIRGGSQLIGYAYGYLAVVHEAAFQPNGQRYYLHRFVIFDNDLNVTTVSKPFVFQARQIEFCAGLCLHPSKDSLLISYGVQDKSAWIGELDWCDLEEFLGEEV